VVVSDGAKIHIICSLSISIIKNKSKRRPQKKKRAGTHEVFLLGLTKCHHQDVTFPSQSDIEEFF